MAYTLHVITDKLQLVTFNGVWCVRILVSGNACILLQEEQQQGDIDCRSSSCLLEFIMAQAFAIVS